MRIQATIQSYKLYITNNLLHATCKISQTVERRTLNIVEHIEGPQNSREKDLEYCIPTWSPYLAKDIDLPEKIQHHATKLVSDISSCPYTDRLRYLGLHSLFC